MESKKVLKRLPIRKKIQRMVMAISIAALIVTSSAGIVSMMRIQGDSESALIHQMEQNLRTIIEDKARFADSELSKYAGYLLNCAEYARDLYRNPSNYAAKNVRPPLMENAGVFAMQRFLENPDISFEAVSDEVTLLGNLEQVFDPIIRHNSSIVTTIYAGTKRGVMVDYDAQSELAENVEGTEQYYAFFSYDWYHEPMNTGKTYFSAVYWDEYRDKPVLACAVPFYDAEGECAGVIGMDIQVADIYSELVNIDLGEGAQVFLADQKDRIIEGYDSKGSSRTLFDDTDANEQILSDILARKTGIALSDNGIYYAYTPISMTDWKLCVKIPESTILSPVRSVNRTIIMTMLMFTAAFALIIVIVIITARKFSAKLTSPIVALDRDVSRISSGNLDHRAEIRTNDEIGDLAQSFNTMAASLKDYIKNLAAVTAEKERIGAELNVATQIQADMLPKILSPYLGHKKFELYATMNPAKEVGGDFYDFFLIDDEHLGLVMADVSGKGVPAALFMVIAKTLIKNRAMMGGTPREILADVNNQLCEGNEADLFVTVWLGILDLSTGKVIASNAGHEYPAICRAGGSYELFKTKQSPAVATMEGLRFRESEFTLNHGDSLYVYTDGVAEATNIHDELYGTDRMLEVLDETHGMTAQEVLSHVKQSVDEFTGEAPQFDDITMLYLKFTGGEHMHELEVEAATERLDEVLNFIDGHLEEWGCPMKTQTQINIAAEELFVNIAHYSGSETARITVAKNGTDAEITFTDSGTPYNPLEKPDPDITLSAEERSIGGLGIYIVKKSMDSVSYEHKDGKNVLTIRKNIA
ncbi:MAG: SpoIIE family protein phosphatase [Synergistaceae bacterium]|nr:SpoIIE family protein phosphatase [Synergistaceae bacterium]